MYLLTNFIINVPSLAAFFNFPSLLSYQLINLVLLTNIWTLINWLQLLLLEKKITMQISTLLTLLIFIPNFLGGYNNFLKYKNIHFLILVCNVMTHENQVEVWLLDKTVNAWCEMFALIMVHFIDNLYSPRFNWCLYFWSNYLVNGFELTVTIRDMEQLERVTSTYRFYNKEIRY